MLSEYSKYGKYGWKTDQEADKQSRIDELLRTYTGYGVLGINLKEIDKLDKSNKEHFVKRLAKMKHFKEYMAEGLEEMYGAFWIISVPILLVTYFIQRRKVNKYLDNNQEFLI